MVNEREVRGQTLPYYQFYPQQMHMPTFYNEMYDDYAYYYHPYRNGGYIPPYMNGMNAGPPANLNSESERVASARIMQQFLDENGQVDIQKMLQTVGQLADTVQQVSPVIKQLNDLIRAFRT